MISGLISAVVLNWNGKNVISDCLDSLLAQTYPLREIIVIDNGSGDGSLEMIRQRYSGNIRIIQNSENLGFAEGCNIGIRAARGEFIALINSDAALHAEWMNEMARVMRVSEKIGMCASKIYFWEKKETLENTGQTISRDGFGLTRGRLEKDFGQYDSRHAVLCPSGCAGLYRRSMLEECGLFDQKFFAYADDIDIGLRARLMGYYCRFVPSAVAYHRLSASFGLLSPRKVFLLERNRLWVVIKCFPLRHLFASPYHTLSRYFYNFVGIFKNKGPASQFVKKVSIFHLGWILLHAYGSTLINLPHLLSERNKLFKKSRVNSRRFEFWMKHYGVTSKSIALKELSFHE